MRQLKISLTILALTVLVACNQQSSDLKPQLRPIPSELKQELREQFRKLPFEKAHNFRDIGGYQTSDGRIVKWGMIYRSDKLADLTDDDTIYMERLKLKRIVDFRSNTERAAEPDKLATGSVINQESLPIAVTGADITQLTDKISSGDFTADELSQLLVDANREFVEQYTFLYRAWINSILEPNGLPMMFHCTAGKDRTGFGAAIILLALGVPETTVMQDYLATNEFTKDRTETLLTFIKISSLFQVDSDALRPLFAVQPQYLQEAFEAMKEHYGSIDNYLTTGLGLTEEKRQQLRDLLTEAG